LFLVMLSFKLFLAIWPPCITVSISSWRSTWRPWSTTRAVS
jgi:hypothetical protein